MTTGLAFGQIHWTLRQGRQEHDRKHWCGANKEWSRGDGSVESRYPTISFQLYATLNLFWWVTISCIWCFEEKDTIQTTSFKLTEHQPSGNYLDDDTKFLHVLKKWIIGLDKIFLFNFETFSPRPASNLVVTSHRKFYLNAAATATAPSNRNVWIPGK